MTWMYGEDWEYAASRLADSLVMHNGQPFMVMDITPGMEAIGNYLASGEEAIVPAVELDLIPVQLGYVNCVKTAYYACRTPARRYKQGLRKDNLICTGLNGMYIDLGLRKLCDTILNRFPTFKECVSGVKAYKSVAWHRDWAMDNAGLVYYRGSDIVGRVVKGGEQTHVVLDESYSYLLEALVEVT